MAIRSSSFMVIALVANCLAWGVNGRDAGLPTAADTKGLSPVQTESKIRTFHVKGNVSTRDVGRARYGTFDVACELPSRFIRTERFGPSLSVLGFDGTRVIYEEASPDFTLLEPPPQAEVQKWLPRAQADMVQTVLGLFASASRTWRIGSDAQAPGLATIVMDNGSHPFVADIGSKVQLPASLAPFAYSDFRNVEGLQVPFHIKRGTDEWDVQKVEINIQIDAKVFQSPIR